MKIGEL